MIEQPPGSNNLLEDSLLKRAQAKMMQQREEPEYMLRWSEHNPQVIGSFHQLWEENHLTDVTLATDTKSFQAHRLLLSSCSPYFRNLFINNPCKHPTVFLKDVPDRHMELLLAYMYQGAIAVKQHELAEILSTASSLKIRGLTTAEAPPPPSGIEDHEEDLMKPLVVDDKFHHLETASSHSNGSRKAEGRKSSKPKKIRLSSADDEGGMISPNYPISLQEKEQRISPVERTSSNLSPSDDNIAGSDEEKELVIEEPVDFSTSNSESGGNNNPDTKYSILGSYLKSGRTSASSKDEGNYKTVSNNEISESLRRAGLGAGWMDSLNNLSRSAAPRPASRDSRGYSKEDDTNEEDNGEEKEYPQLSLSDTMGIDIAERLRTHFLANLPSQSYSWLNGTSPLLDQVKREKHPSGGIRTGEIGPNGKPSVKCEECGKMLADPSSLYRHRKIHTGDKPHKCPYCDRRFIQRFNMKQHIKTHRIELMAEQPQAVPFQH